MREKKHLIIILPFVALILLFFTMSLFIKDMDTSDEEARALAQRPSIDLANIKDTTSKIDAYLVDQFPHRRRFLKLYSLKDKYLGKINTRNLYVLEDDWLFFESQEFEMASMREVVEKVANLNPEKDFYYAAIPTKNLLLSNKYNLVDNNVSEKNLLSLEFEFDQLVIDNLNFINVYDKLKQKDLVNDQSKQFRTDFHWNALGAKDGVDVILTSMYENGHIDRLTSDGDYSIEILNGNYIGDLNRRFSYIYGNDDKPVIVNAKASDQFVYYMSNDDSIRGKRQDLISPGSDKENVSYSDIYTQNLAFYRIENPEAINKKSIMVIKDSMQNPTSDIFASNFQEVKIIDPRMKQPVNFQKALESVDIVLIMLNQNNNSADVREYLIEE